MDNNEGMNLREIWDSLRIVGILFAAIESLDTEVISDKLQSAESLTITEFFNVLFKTNVHHRVHQKPVIFPVPGQMQPV